MPEYIAEHQPVEYTHNTSATYDPTPEEKKAIKLCESLFGKSKKHREKYDRNWLDNYKMFRGSQWKEIRPAYRHTECINFIFQNIQSQVPILMDSRPKFTYLPQEPNDRVFADIINQVCDADWTKYNWLLHLTETVYDAHFYGSGLATMPYADDKIVFESSDPFYCFPDPEARSGVNDRRSRFFVHAEPTPVELLKKKYPDKARFIKPDITDLYGGDKADLERVRYKSPLDARLFVEDGGGSSSYETDRHAALKITAWIKDDELVECEEKYTDDKGQEQVKKTSQIKYPNGRKIVIASGVLLYDGEMGYDDGQIPFAAFSNYILPREFWGISEVENLASPQRIFNKLLCFSLDVLTLMGNPIWIVDTSSGLDTDNIFNKPGDILEPNPGSRVERVEGVQLQPYVLQLIDRLREWFNDVGGSSDVSRGVQPGGVTAGFAIQSLQEAAQTRIRQKSRNLDAFLQEIGQMYLSRVLQFYTVPQVFRITNDQNVEQFFRFHVEHDEQSGQKTAHYTPMEQGTDGKYFEGMPQEIPAATALDVKVTTGSSLPFAKAEKSNLALQLFDRQIIDPEEVLTATDYPNKEKVLERLKQAALQAPPEQAQSGGGNNA